MPAEDGAVSDNEVARLRMRLERVPRLSFANKMARALWHIVWLFLFRPSPRVLHPWRRLLLRLFGAKVGKGAHPYPSARIWAPWNLELGPYSCLAQHVDCYCVAKIRIGAHVTISQYSFLCTASHDFTDPQMALFTAPITIKDWAWITADVFIAPGVTIGEGAVVGARSSVFSNVADWSIAKGHPAAQVGRRIWRASRAEPDARN